MKRLHGFIAVIFILCAISIPSYAQDKTVSDIVVVDVQRVEALSKAGKKLQDKISEEREKIQKEISSIEKDMREKQSALVKEKDKLEAEAFKKKAQEFEEDLLKAQKKIKEKRNEFEKKIGTSLGKLRGEIVKAVGDISSERKYKLVITRQNVVIVEKTIDITEDVLAEVDARVKSIPF